MNISDAAVRGMSKLVSALALDKAARETRDKELLETGRKAFMMQIELTNLLVTTKDAHEKMMLEKGYKKADREWFSKRQGTRR
jgi:hypothetical protein